MTILPDRRRGLALGLSFLIAVIMVAVTGLIQLSRSPVTALLVVWVGLPVVMAPIAIFIVYRIFGLMTARYQLDRDAFYLEWGLAREQLPIEAIAGLYRAEEVARHLTPDVGFWWPGCMVGRRDIPGKGSVEFFATSDSDGLVLLRVGDRFIAISPPDPEAFNQAFIDATRMGSLNRMESTSFRPSFLTGRILQDRLAGASLITGLLSTFLLMGFLAVRIPYLPGEVAFGFSSSGVVSTLAPPTRLLLLPLISGLSWIGNTLGGILFYRQEETRVMAYLLWFASVLISLLFWGAVFQLLSTG